MLLVSARTRIVRCISLSQQGSVRAACSFITWDKAERIERAERIWSDSSSVVHRLPEHYKRRYWDSVMADWENVHWLKEEQLQALDANGREPESWTEYNEKKLPFAKYDSPPCEDRPITVIYPKEAQAGLWGGEGVVKAFIRGRPHHVKKKKLPRHWRPFLLFPTVLESVVYSEVLDRHMKLSVTNRTLDLIDQHAGLDFYLLETPEYNLRSKLGRNLKRWISIYLSRPEDYLYPSDSTKRALMLQKYKDHILPADEAEWVGLDLNEACVKLQDDERAREGQVVPLKEKLQADAVRERKKSLEDIEASRKSRQQNVVV